MYTAFSLVPTPRGPYQRSMALETPSSYCRDQELQTVGQPLVLAETGVAPSLSAAVNYQP